MLHIKVALAAMALARSLDASSTCSALQRGAVEGNPLLPKTCTGAVVAQGGIAGLQGYGLNKLAKRHPKIAQVLAWSTVGIEGFVVWHNNRVAR